MHKFTFKNLRCYTNADDKLRARLFLRNAVFQTLAIASATCVFPLPVGATITQFFPSIAFSASSSWYVRSCRSSGCTGCEWLNAVQNKF